MYPGIQRVGVRDGLGLVLDNGLFIRFMTFGINFGDPMAFAPSQTVTFNNRSTAYKQSDDITIEGLKDMLKQFYQEITQCRQQIKESNQIFLSEIHSALAEHVEEESRSKITEDKEEFHTDIDHLMPHLVDFSPHMLQVSEACGVAPISISDYESETIPRAFVLDGLSLEAPLAAILDGKDHCTNVEHQLFDELSQPGKEKIDPVSVSVLVGFSVLRCSMFVIDPGRVIFSKSAIDEGCEPSFTYGSVWYSSELIGMHTYDIFFVILEGYILINVRVVEEPAPFPHSDILLISSPAVSGLSKLFPIDLIMFGMFEIDVSFVYDHGRLPIGKYILAIWVSVINERLESQFRNLVLLYNIHRVLAENYVVGFRLLNEIKEWDNWAFNFHVQRKHGGVLRNLDYAPSSYYADIFVVIYDPRGSILQSIDGWQPAGNLPYEWTTCSFDHEKVCSKVYTLLTNNYDENMFKFNISPLKSHNGRPRTQFKHLIQIDQKGWGVSYVSSFQQCCPLQMLNSVATC